MSKRKYECLMGELGRKPASRQGRAIAGKDGAYEGPHLRGSHECRCDSRANGDSWIGARNPSISSMWTGRKVILDGLDIGF